MKRTQLKASRKWLAQMMSQSLAVNGKSVNPPMFAQTYLMRGRLETKGQNSWYGFAPEFLGFVDKKDLYEAAKKFHLEIVGGIVKVGPPPTDDEVAAATETPDEVM
jgi:hypothetical protein